MANLLLPSYYGSNFVDGFHGIKGISLQLHITAKCDQRCKHCYMYDSPFYQPQIETPLTKEELLQLIDDFFEFLAEYGCYCTLIAISGGDPILSPYFWDILEHIHSFYSKRCSVLVMGNSYHITLDAAKKMKSKGVYLYQISLDGLRETHDMLRKPGSFNDSIRALHVLHEAGLKSTVMMTISKLNVNEVIPLFDYLSTETPTNGFSFDRMIPTGNAKEIKESLFTADEYRDFLFEVYKHQVFSHSRLLVVPKDQMWKLLFYEQGLLDPINITGKKMCVTGCIAGTEAISILADGTVLPCRRMDLSAGKYPEKSLKEIIINNDVTKQIISLDKFEKCSECSINLICQGCPAMKYAATGSIFSCDPYCWRRDIYE